MQPRAWIVGAVTAATCLVRAAVAQDTIHVRADNPPVWGANVQLAKLFAIGAVDGPDEYAFGRIGYFAAFSDGRFFVYDEKDVLIRYYDANGKFIAKVGGKGDGPGEYRLLMGMDILGDSLLVTWDVRNNRVSYFGRDGRYVTSVILTRASRSFGPKMFGVDAKGLFYLNTTVARAAEPGNDPLRSFVRFAASGNVVDSVRIPPDDDGNGVLVQGTSDGRRLNFPVATVSSLYPPGGMLQGRTDRYAISVPASAVGRPLVIEHRYDPVPLRDEERAEWSAIVQDFANAPRPAPRPNVNLGPPFAAQPLPRVKPAFRELLGDPDGRIWVEVYTTAEKRVIPPSAGKGLVRARLTWRERAVHDVFSRDGKFLGRVALPPQCALLSARGDRIWVQSVGENDEETIIAYRLVTRG